MNIQLSELDTERFGVASARISVTATDSVERILDWCNSNRVTLLIARCNCNNIQLAQQMEKSGFCLGDVLVYYRCTQFALNEVVLPSGYSWREARPEDANAVERLAGVAFKAYFGHYHTDPKLDSAAANMVYSSWARKLCQETGFSSPFFLIETNSTRELAGFLSARVLDSIGMEIVLNGVNPKHRKRGLYDSLVRLVKNWAARRSSESMIASTHLTNIAVQKIWCRHGFEPYDSYFTFHKWFDQ